MSDEGIDAKPRACVLTPRGRGAIGVVRVWGAGALAAASGVFRPARGEGLGATPPRRPRLGRIGAGIGDEVVAVVLDGEPPEIEIQCHGGPAAVDLVVEALVTAGAVLVEPGAFARHASASPIRAAAMEDLAKASTLRAAEVLLEQAQRSARCGTRSACWGDRDGSSPGARRVGSVDPARGRWGSVDLGLADRDCGAAQRRQEPAPECACGLSTGDCGRDTGDDPRRGDGGLGFRGLAGRAGRHGRRAGDRRPDRAVGDRAGASRASPGRPAAQGVRPVAAA